MQSKHDSNPAACDDALTTFWTSQLNSVIKSAEYLCIYFSI